MNRKPISSFWVLTLIAALLAAAGAWSPPGNATAGFELPGDVELVTSFHLPKYGLTYERYQQVFDSARVLGGQLTVYRDSSGQVVSVIGAHYEDIAPSNAVGLSRGQANGLVTRDIGADGERLVDLMIHPDSGRFFYRVETRRADSRWIHWLDAGSGQFLNKFNALAHGCDNLTDPCGFGVAYDNGDVTDEKDMSGLTTWNGSAYALLSADGRQETHDQGSTRRPFLGPVATDADDSWVLAGDISPAQPALVDAQYYANVTDDYYLGQHGYDWVAAGIADPEHNVTKMVVHAHYTYYYVNAFWNGSYVAIGDGDQVSYRELTPLDVVAHEFTHGVTDFTSNLIYQDESGALNEAFSDIMATSAEYWAEAAGREPGITLEPDWLIGEDLDLRGGENPGLRNMADPNEDGDPSHYLDRYTGSDDNGGVHTNSGIANHWYYLLVEGGQNANPLRASGTDVIGIGLANAEPIAFLGFTALPENATFCDARLGTIAVAGAYSANVADAWDEVGVTEALCGGGSTNQPPAADFTFSTSDLTATFTDASSDSDGSVVSWSWDFGDSAASTQQNPSHTYAAGGTYAVTLTVTDDGGATDSVTKNVTVNEPSGGISLSAVMYKSRAYYYVDLTWTGAGSTSVDLYRDGAILITTPNDGAYTDNLGKSNGPYTYKVCEAGTAICSNSVTVP